MKRVLLLVGILGCSAKTPPPIEEPPPPIRVPAIAITPKNAIFAPAGDCPPRARIVALPEFNGAASIWGATGRDHRGQIYVGVSCEEIDRASAHLFAINPANGEATDLGGAIEQLQRLDLAKPDESQNKIHTKILQASDGNLYFASMDESGENEDGSKLPTFGSHIWRLAPGEKDWQHLGHFREAIIAAAVSGDFVYFLGYFGHVLHQFSISQNRFVNSVRVGSVGGHTTRNFLADARGHAYVPRVTAEQAELVEFDEELHEVKAFPLEGYSRTPDSTSHGIVAIAPLAEDGWLFTTDRGHLYRLDPRATGSTLTRLGRIHPRGHCYAACLFCLDGQSQVAAIGTTVEHGEPVYDWISFDLKTRQSTATPLRFPLPREGYNLLLFGSYTRDDSGRCYLGGRYLRNEGEKILNLPVLWAVEP